ncbi:hypothetical protein ACEPAG_4248 [Sanghuangporus baumii]
MSVKKSKLDLLFKVRFQNPLPPPPIPPKLVNIPTNPSRYAAPDFTASLASETPLPMVVDAELGMPLDLSYYECLWEEGADDSQINPDPEMLPPIDPKDAFMLVDAPMSATNGTYSSGTPPTPQVSWLRKTEYISSSVNRTPTVSYETRRTTADDLAAVDISRDAQLRDIEKSFKTAGEELDLSKLKHPNKPGVTAVESYELLPDAEIWANAYDLFRFSERPGDRAPDIPDPRLECGILRPMEADGDHFLAYFLPREDEAAENFVEMRRSGEITEETVFSFIRDYETVKIEEDISNEFLLVLEDGEGVKPEEDVKSQRKKGAYYKNVERKIMLKKRRAVQWDTYSDKWDAINLSLAPFTSEELEERDEARAEVVDPNYMFSRDADADGEVDDTHDADVQHDNKEGVVEVVEVGDEHAFGDTAGFCMFALTRSSLLHSPKLTRLFSRIHHPHSSLTSNTRPPYLVHGFLPRRTMPPTRTKTAAQSATFSSIDVTFLGTASAVPSSTRNQSALAIHLGGRGDLWLFDCGESTQRRLQESALRMGKIKKIFITHTHGDHIFGIAPLMAGCMNGGGGMIEGIADPRLQPPDSEPLEIYGPLGTRAYIRSVLHYTRTTLQGRYVVHELRFPYQREDGDHTNLRLHHCELPGKNLLQTQEEGVERGKGVWHDIYADDLVSVSAAPIEHSIPCVGYVMEEAPLPEKMDPTKYVPHIKRNKAPMAYLARLQRGETITLEDGTVLEGVSRRPGRKLVILGDTHDPSPILPLATGADLLIHEATNAYLPGVDPFTRDEDTEEDVEERTRSRGHSTPQMAGRFARAAGVRRLVLNHFSARYKGDVDVNEESKAIMDAIRGFAEKEFGGEVVCARDFMTISVQHAR